MKRIYLIIVVILLTVSCNSGVDQHEYDKLKAELAECRKIVEELQNTPQVRLSNGQQYLSKSDIENAKKELNTLIEKFGGTEEAAKAKSLIADIEKEERKAKEAEERKRTLGFKVLKESSSVDVGEVTVKFNSVSTGKSFVFDRYDDSWRYRDAERGEIYVLANVAISSNIKEPKLPPISIYKIEDGKLNLIGALEYRFYRWEDYGSYLGNDADYGNDFAHTSTIRFSCGLPIPKEYINDNVIFIVIKKENCFHRTADRFSNPPISYTASGCNSKSVLSVDDFDNDYALVKIFNRNKL